MASNSRKKVFPKKPERLNSTSAKLLGKNSNKVCRQATVKGIYQTQPKIVDSLTDEQRKQLAKLRVNLQAQRQQ